MKGKTGTVKRKNPFLINANIHIPLQFSRSELTRYYISYPKCFYLMLVIQGF